VTQELRDTVVRLLTYCKDNEWGGYDPYDALNSALYRATPCCRNRLCNIAFTQILKRLPVNLRPLLQVPREQNAKGVALFLSALLKLTRAGIASAADGAALVRLLAALRSPEEGYWCWGYSFPWQTRSHLVPKGAPNLVCTSFVANALLDAHEEWRGAIELSMAASAADYLLEKLYWEDGGERAGFSYPLPGIRVQVHNANFLGAALLSRVFRHTGERRYLEAALRAARYSAGEQHSDGSWDYGELPSQRWVDNFHTGYNLCALRTVGRCAGTTEFEPALLRGYRFYREHFFRPDGAPKYFHDREYPIDVHCVAQSLITLTLLKDLDESAAVQACRTYRWSMRHLWDGRGYFHYRIGPFMKNTISYMRWSQAWMLLALAVLMEGGAAKEREKAPSARSLSREVDMVSLQQEEASAAPDKAALPSFVLITPARNEAVYLETILDCMVRQTVRPLKWVIVSDGSTDGTDDIVARYAARHPWIELVRMPERAERHFAGKVHAFNAGMQRVKDLPYEVIGNLDADISFDADYFSFILRKFRENPALGVAGTPFTEGGARYDYRFTSIEHVSGQCQLFRRECFESIGGYLPRKIGGIDLVAVLTAQMHGWQTRTFPGKTFVHHRKMGTGMHGSLMTHYRWGVVDFVLGMHPLWEFCRCLYQMTRKPYLAGGGLRVIGYLAAFLSGKEKDLPPELVRFRRKSQMARLKKFFRDRFSHPFTGNGGAAPRTDA